MTPFRCSFDNWWNAFKSKMISFTSTTAAALQKRKVVFPPLSLSLSPSSSPSYSWVLFFTILILKCLVDGMLCLGQHFHQLLTGCCQVFPPAPGCTLCFFLPHCSLQRFYQIRNSNKLVTGAGRGTVTAFRSEKLTMINMWRVKCLKSQTLFCTSNWEFHYFLAHHCLTQYAFCGSNQSTFFAYRMKISPELPLSDTKSSSE